MYTVSRRAQSYKQPRGGFIKPSSFEVIKLEDTISLNEEENISPSIVGTVVDYMTRFMEGTPITEAFRISLKGATLIKSLDVAENLLKRIKDIDDESIIAACKIVGFDTVLRAGPMTYKPIEQINPDKDTIFNIVTMIKRSQKFFEEYGPVLEDGITFFGGYTPTVISGDGDFMTKDTLWDFKVTKNPIKSSHTLQLLMYYLMGCRAIYLNAEFDFKNQIKKLGIYNPRKNEIYIKHISEIDKDIIKEVETNVIGYGKGVKDPYIAGILKKIIDDKNQHE